MTRMQVCLELSERELHLLIFFPETRKGQLVNLNQVKYDSYPIPEGWLKHGQVQLQRLTELLKEVRLAHKIPENTLTWLAIPLVNGFIREYSLPWIAPKHREAAIQYLAREEMPIPQDNQVTGYLVTEADKKQNRLRVTLGATRRSIFEDILQAFREAGFKLAKVQFAAAAFGDALGLKPQEHYLYLSETNGGIQVLLYHGILPEITRFFPASAESDAKEWVSEIGRIFGLMSSDVSISRIFISGEKSTVFLAKSIVGAEFPGLTSMTEIVSIEQIARAWPWRENRPEVIFPYLPCLGLALEGGSKGKTQNVNLLSEYLMKLKESRQQRMMVGIILLSLLCTSGLWFYGKNQQKILQTEVEGIKNRALSQQAQERNENNLVNAWKKTKGLSQEIPASLKLLQELEGNGIAFERLEYKEAILTLQGTAKQAGQLEHFLTELYAQDWRQVQLREYRQEKPSVINFTVTAVR